MQTLMLVIHGKTQFHTTHEHWIFHEKLRSFNQVRKAAQKKPGLFPPVEACLWSHQVIINLAMKLQRAMCRGDSASAWKNDLFHGCFEESSERDPSGKSLYTSARLGDDRSHLLRKLAELSGQFSTPAQHPSPLSAELNPSEQATAATSTSSGYHVRTFGDRDISCTPHQTITRPCNHALDLPHEIQPRDVRIETLRRKRMARDALMGPRENHPLIAHSDLVAQKRYEEWMTRTHVPAAAMAAKQEMFPFFEGLVSPTADTFSAPLATCKRKDPAKRSSVAEAPARPPMSAEVIDAVAAAKEADCAVKQFQQVRASSATRKSGGEAEGDAPRQTAAPQTAEEIGKLFQRMDALQTILEVDSSEIGGFAHRCPAGWKSGYRVEPMSKDEIRRAHVVQNFCSGVPTAA
jgi:hypothetical protein